MELQLTKDINQPNLTTSEVITLHDPLTPHSTQPFLVSMVNNTQPSSSESVIGELLLLVIVLYLYLRKYGPTMYVG